jgi:hypothetical protein
LPFFFFFGAARAIGSRRKGVYDTGFVYSGTLP